MSNMATSKLFSGQSRNRYSSILLICYGIIISYIIDVSSRIFLLRGTWGGWDKWTVD